MRAEEKRREAGEPDRRQRSARSAAASQRRRMTPENGPTDEPVAAKGAPRAERPSPRRASRCRAAIRRRQPSRRPRASIRTWPAPAFSNGTSPPRAATRGGRQRRRRRSPARRRAAANPRPRSAPYTVPPPCRPRTRKSVRTSPSGATGDRERSRDRVLRRGRDAPFVPLARRRTREGTRRGAPCDRTLLDAAYTPAHGHRHARGARRPARRGRRRALPPLRPHRHAVRRGLRRRIRARRSSSTCCACSLDELQELGLEDAAIDEHGYVTATLPATVDRDVPTIAFFAHVDTARECSGANVKPQRIRYEGGDIVLGDSGPGDPPGASRRSCEHHVGHELITTDGTTLLGADDKAGIAEIMAAAAYLVAHPEVPHGPVKVAFNPDEEIGRGVDPLPGRHVRRRRRVHGRRLDGRRGADGDVLRRAGADDDPRPRDPSGLGEGRARERDQARGRASSSGCRRTGCRPRRPRSARGTSTRS